MRNSIRACREDLSGSQLSGGDILQRLAASYESEDKHSLNESEVVRYILLATLCYTER
jgi:hypothetical protein